jgi:hypothetical protein
MYKSAVAIFVMSLATAIIVVVITPVLLIAGGTALAIPAGIVAGPWRHIYRCGRVATIIAIAVSYVGGRGWLIVNGWRRITTIIVVLHIGLRIWVGRRRLGRIAAAIKDDAWRNNTWWSDAWQRGQPYL